MMAAAVGMVSKRTRTSPCWDDEVDARNAEASEKWWRLALELRF